MNSILETVKLEKRIHSRLIFGFFVVWQILFVGQASAIESLTVHRVEYNNDEGRDTFLLNWNSNENTRYFRIDVSLDPEFSKFQKYFSDQNFFFIGARPQKKYFFRVFSVNSNDQAQPKPVLANNTESVSLWKGELPKGNEDPSEVVEIGELPLPTFHPGTLLPEPETESQAIFQLVKFQGVVPQFKEKDHYFEIQISKSTDFTENNKFFSHQASIPITVFPNRDYYLRYRAKNPKHEPISDFSPVAHLRITCCQPMPLVEHVEEEEVEPEKTERMPSNLNENKISTLETGIKVLPDGWVSIGSGMDFSDQTQTIDSISDLQFQSFRGPSVSLAGGLFLSESWALAGYFKNTRAQIDNAQNGQPSIEYNLNSYSVETFWRPDNLKNSISQWFLRGGLIFYEMPFVSVVDTTSSRVEVEKSQILAAAIGAGYERQFWERWSGEVFLRYQQPMSASGSNVSEVSPQFSFDGSIGFNYAIYKKAFLGAYWFGQFHQLKYQITGSSPQSGSQRLLQSHFDLRFGFRF